MFAYSFKRGQRILNRRLHALLPNRVRVKYPNDGSPAFISLGTLVEANVYVEAHHEATCTLYAGS